VAAGARSPRFFLAAAAIVAVTVPWPLVDSRAEANLPTTPVRLAIGPVPEWSAARSSDGDFEPRFVSPSAVVHEQYDRGSGTVGLYVAYYRGQTFDRKVVSSENRLPIGIDDPWNLTGTPSIDISVGGQRYAMPLISLVSRDGRRLYALKWYWVDGVVTPSDARAKAQVSWSRITGRGDDAAAIVVYSRAATVKDAQTELQRFVDDAWPPVATALAQARELR
jgi:EpsI family protein